MAAITIEQCIGGRDLSEPRLHPSGAAVVYGVGEAGTAQLVWHPLGGAARAITTEPAPRLGRGLGGGCWCWIDGGAAVAYAAADGNLWAQPVAGGVPRRLIDHGPDRAAAAPHASPGGDVIAYVVDQAEVWTVTTAGAAPPAATRIDDGAADFCFDPYVTPCATGVVWQAWNVPDMPWDGAHVQRCTLATGVVDGYAPPGAAVQQPRTMPDGDGIFVSDGTGWLNVWLGDAPLVGEPFEHAGPSWGMGQRSFAVSPAGDRVAFTRNERGFGRLCVVDVRSREVTEVARGVHGQLSWVGHRLSAIRTGGRTPTQIVVYDTDTWDRTVVATGPGAAWSTAALVEPEVVTATAGDGSSVHARLYRADAPTRRLICWLHGGPTDQWQVTFLPRIAYWRAQGWNVLVPDHRGSTGHGRAYQQALYGRWGELDVADTVDAVLHAHAAGWGEPATTVIAGGSAGGFTALGAIAARPELFAAGVVSYPVTDLVELAERSHRFERHATQRLVGPLPGSEELHRRRSPVAFADRLVGTPLLVLHGDVDPVVPLRQSEVLVERCRAAGGTAELHVYPGEGHGFRQREHQIDEYRRIADFLRRHLPAR